MHNACHEKKTKKGDLQVYDTPRRGERGGGGGELQCTQKNAPCHHYHLKRPTTTTTKRKKTKKGGEGEKKGVVFFSYFSNHQTKGHNKHQNKGRRKEHTFTSPTTKEDNPTCKWGGNYYF